MPSFSRRRITSEARQSIIPQLMERAMRIRRANAWEDTPTSAALEGVAVFLAGAQDRLKGLERVHGRPEEPMVSCGIPLTKKPGDIVRG